MSAATANFPPTAATGAWPTGTGRAAEARELRPGHLPSSSQARLAFIARLLNTWGTP